MNAIPFSPVAKRFAWKEFRTLRGFWIAVVVIGTLVQCVLMLLAAPGADVPMITLGAALGSAVFYAVGAAAIMFAVEHEDETYGFLSGLPTTWLPIFLAKLGAAISSSIAMAVVLALTGWCVAGGRWPSSSNCNLQLGLYGIAIFEAIAWGTLFSLMFRRPLVAVLWTLAVGSVAMHLAVNASSTSVTASADLHAYSQAIPMRLSIVAAVMFVAMAVARGWLSSGRSAAEAASITSTLKARLHHAVGQFRTHRSSVARQAHVAPVRKTSHRAALARLMWQAWRSSWKMLLLPFLVAIFLYAGIVGIGGFIVGPEFAGLVTGAFAFLLPTLYGAMAFGNDQRRASYRFLAEHSAPPRYVWLSRHIVWLGSLLALTIALFVAATIATLVGLEVMTGQNIRSDYWLRRESRLSMARQFQYSLDFVLSGSLLGWLGAISAYAIGQLCSMLLRSEILAAFIGTIFSAVLSAWIAVVWLWDLNAWLCLLPLFVGLMLATWLRAPDWIVGRNSWQGWWKPTLAVALPVALLALALPEMRRLELTRRASPEMPFRLNSNHYANGDSPEAKETATMYQRAAAIPVYAPDQQFSERWHQREFWGDGENSDQIDQTKMSPIQWDDYLRESKEQQALQQQHLKRAAALIIEASQRPSCRFDYDWSEASVPTDYDRYYGSNRETNDLVQSAAHSNYYQVLTLPIRFPFWDLPPAEAVEFQLAALRLLDHLRQGQPTGVVYRNLDVEREFLASVVNWAATPAVPTAEVRKLLSQMQEYFQASPIDLVAPFTADDRIVRDVLLGKTPPQILATKNPSYAKYLAFLANELPGERERALVALNQITLQNQHEAAELAQYMHRVGEYWYSNLQRWLANRNSPAEDALAWNSQLGKAATSYLTRLEYEARVPVRLWLQNVLEAETCRRAAVLRVALILYHRDHGKYPALLSDLVPDYLQQLPKDPFTGNMQPFSYSSTGVELPLTRYGTWGSPQIPPRTPFIWSAGPSDVRLVRREHQLWATDESDPSKEPIEQKTSYYALEGNMDERGRYYERSLVFPLPQISTSAE
jgi:hypothetical protein